jgi:hypothetical protein
LTKFELWGINGAMGVERGWVGGLERDVWRGTGAVLAVETVKLLATLPFPRTESQAIQMLGLGLLLPLWLGWSEVRGNWFKEDFSKLTNFLDGKTK